MAVSYTQELRDYAKEAGLWPVTLNVGAVTYQEAVTEEGRDEVLEFLLAFKRREAARLMPVVERLAQAEPGKAVGK